MVRQNMPPRVAVAADPSAHCIQRKGAAKALRRQSRSRARRQWPRVAGRRSEAPRRTQKSTRTFIWTARRWRRSPPSSNAHGSDAARYRRPRRLRQLGLAGHHYDAGLIKAAARIKAHRAPTSRLANRSCASHPRSLPLSLPNQYLRETRIQAS